MDHGINAPVPSYEDARAYPYSEADRRRIAHNRRRLVLGAPGTVRARLLELAAASEAVELMIVTITGDYDSRLKSYELLARAFDLGRPGLAARVNRGERLKG